MRRKAYFGEELDCSIQEQGLTGEEDKKQVAGGNRQHAGKAIVDALRVEGEETGTEQGGRVAARPGEDKVKDTRQM